eukprot:TRINITY_DN11803_c0_g3_i1.p1 TRINITY_DN11803_c0_g3~~TRINITY_DN11803_c0_g3_i1.p1  ORF type:complete len:389 (+),score=29.43 TRINITY_DN11803_c0_g3_i1:103-1269(+)
MAISVDWADNVVNLIFVLCFAVLGGVLNHMRGENGGMLTSKAFAAECKPGECTGYWVAHVYTRLLMAMPTGALVYFFTKRAKLSLLFTFVMWSSIFLGWGSYFHMGQQPALNVRSGFVDWLLGREPEGWDRTYRWLRTFAGMGLRGLVWTLPSGHLLQMAGYGSQFALSGAFMPVIYTLGNYAHHLKTAAHWQPKQCSDPPFEQDWAFAPGINMAEFLFGFWLWLCLLAPLNRYRPRLSWTHASPRWLTAIMFVFTAMLVGSTVWYGFVDQHDRANWGQSLAALAINSLSLLLSLTYQHRQSERPLHSTISVQDENAPLLSVSRRDVLPDWARHDTIDGPSQKAIFRWMENCLLCLHAIALVMTVGFALFILVFNWHASRFCNGLNCP